MDKKLILGKTDHTLLKQTKLKRAESVDFPGVREIVPIDPVAAPCLPL